jgi:hypothetical protein
MITMVKTRKMRMKIEEDDKREPAVIREPLRGGRRGVDATVREGRFGVVLDHVERGRALGRAAPPRGPPPFIGGPKS